MRVPFPETVTIIRASLDPYGDPTGTVETDVPGCAVSPRGLGAQTRTFDQDTTVTYLTVLFPPGTNLLSSDQIRVRGVVYRVDGVPTRDLSPISGRDYGIEASLITTTG